MSDELDAWEDLERAREEKRRRKHGANGADLTAIAPPPIQPPPPPSGTGPQPAQPGPQPQSNGVDEVLKVYQKWLLLTDWTPAYAMLGTIAGCVLDGDPIWLALVAPASSAKTELLNSLTLLPHTQESSSLTPAALLSGTPKNQRTPGATGGLLRQIGRFGFLVLKDFGSIIDMRADDRNVILAALREIYDGRWTRHLGTDGGRKLHWAGKLGLLFGVTPAIDLHQNILARMGNRFLFSRLAPCDDQFDMALDHVGAGTFQMRREMAEAVATLFKRPLRQPQVISDDERAELKPIVLLATKLRGAVERDSHTREFLGIEGAEGPSRLALTLERLLAGLDALGVSRMTGMQVVKRVALDSVPPIRRKVYEILDPQIEMDTTGVAKIVEVPTTTARRALEDLVGYKLARRSTQGTGKADLWRKN